MKPIARIVKIAEFEAGLMGLNEALHDIYTMGLDSADEIQRHLLKRIREFGNYIPASRESDYKEALLREYREYVNRVCRDKKGSADRSRRE